MDEIVFVLGRCTDNSEALIRTHADLDKTRIIVKKQVNWKNSRAEAKSIGCKKAQGEILFILDADVIPGKDLVSKALLTFSGGTEIVSNKNTRHSGLKPTLCTYAPDLPKKNKSLMDAHELNCLNTTCLSQF